MFHHAKAFLDQGFNILPLIPNGKKPAVEWKFLQERKALLGECAAWFGHGSKNNLGLVCGRTSGDLFVKDFDDLEKARRFFSEFRNRIKTITETPRPGVHFYFRKSEGRNTQGDKEDARGHGGYVAAPPSLIEGTPYRFVDGFGLVPPHELCEAPEEETERPIHRPAVRAEIKNVRAYIRKIVAVSGSGGHSSTFRVACKLRDAGLTEAEALAELLEWNTSNSEPPWSMQELVHKVNDAYSKVKK